MDKITFENATLVNPAKVTIDGVDYEVTPEETTGGTPASANTFNTMQENIEKSVVAVSSTEPSTNERVWLKKGKNLDDLANNFSNAYFDTGSFEVRPSDFDALSDYIEIQPNEPYVVSVNTTIKYIVVVIFDSNKNYITHYTTVDGTYKAFTTNSNAKYIRYWVNLDATTTMTSQIIRSLDVMLEQNSTATTFEPYVDKEILVKNDNGVFEEFYSEQQKDKSSVLLYTGGISNTTDTLTYTGDISNYDKLIIQLGSTLEGDSKIIEIDSQGNVINVSAYLNAFVNSSYNCSASILASNNEVQMKGRQLSGWSTVPIRIFGVTR